MIARALVCDCCGTLIAVDTNKVSIDVVDMREAGKNGQGPGGAAFFCRKDMCGKCWGRGCEIGKKHLRRAS